MNKIKGKAEIKDWGVEDSVEVSKALKPFVETIGAVAIRWMLEDEYNLYYFDMNSSEPLTLKCSTEMSGGDLIFKVNLKELLELDIEDCKADGSNAKHLARLSKAFINYGKYLGDVSDPWIKKEK